MYCYQMPPTPCRPELGTQRYKQPFSTDHDFMQMRRNIGICIKLLKIPTYSIPCTRNPFKFLPYFHHNS